MPVERVAAAYRQRGAGPHVLAPRPAPLGPELLLPVAMRGGEEAGGRGLQALLLLRKPVGLGAQSNVHAPCPDWHPAAAFSVGLPVLMQVLGPYGLVVGVGAG